MPQCAAGNFTAGGNVANQFDAIRIGSFRRINFLKRPFHAVERGSEREVANKAGLRIGVQGAYRRADLIVAVGCNVFHQEVDEACIALQDVKQLQRAIAGLRKLYCRFDGLRNRFDKTELRSDVVRQDA